MKTTDAGLSSWKDEYRNSTRGGFGVAADFLARFLVGKTFDEFVADVLQNSRKVELIKVGVMLSEESELILDYIYPELYVRRNRIMHRGDVSFTSDEASRAFGAAL